MNSQEWENLADMTSELCCEQDYVLIELDGHLYAICSDWCMEESKCVAKYNIDENRWSDCCELPQDVMSSSVVVFDKKLLILNAEKTRDDKMTICIIMYDPLKDESNVVLKPTEIDSPNHDGMILTVQNEVCYFVTKTTVSSADFYSKSISEYWVASDSENSEGDAKHSPDVESNPRVFKLDCKLNQDPPSIEIGEEIPQTHPHQCNHIGAFCIDDKSFVNVYGCVHKIKDGVVDESDLVQWRFIRKTKGSCVHFTFDRRFFSEQSQLKPKCLIDDLKAFWKSFYG